MADAPAPRQPNRPLAMLFLIVTVLGTLATASLGMWELLQENRKTGFAWLFTGLGVFLFFSWMSRAALRPGPQG